MGHFDNAGLTGARRALDIVIGGGSNVMIFYGDDMPVASGDAAASLSEWGTTTSIATLTPVGFAIEKLVVAPLGSTGYADILFTARDGSGNTKREIIYSTQASAEQRDLTGTTTVEDVELADENGKQILAILPVDANQDGAIDYVYAFEDGSTKLVLTRVQPRTDLSQLEIIQHLIDQMNPNTPSS